MVRREGWGGVRERGGVGWGEGEEWGEGEGWGAFGEQLNVLHFMLRNLGLGRIMSTAADCDMKLIKSSPSGSSNVPL